jgi:folylpolyglutamate synthase/dihydropteroate synthase
VSFKPPTVRQAEEEKRVLLERIKNLEAYIEALHKISSNGHGRLAKGVRQVAIFDGAETGQSLTEEGSAPIETENAQSMNTAAVAYRVLSASPKSIRLADVVKGMREAGWQGSGNDKTDQDRAYAAMYRATDKFYRPRWAHWAVKRERASSTT